jgi:nitrite reductase (NADH) small subunit
MYQHVCQLKDIGPNGGVAALIGSQQVALFRVQLEGIEHVFGISNYDPFSGANVLSRGILCTMNNEIVVASPIYKQHFSLQSGKCLEDDSVQLKTWLVSIDRDKVFVFNDEVVAA